MLQLLPLRLCFFETIFVCIKPLATENIADKLFFLCQLRKDILLKHGKAFRHIVHKKYAYFPYFMVFLKYGSTGENCPYFFRTSREKKSHLKFAWKRKRPVPSPAHFLVEMIEGACGGWGVQHSLGQNWKLFPYYTAPANHTIKVHLRCKPTFKFGTPQLQSQFGLPHC